MLTVHFELMKNSLKKRGYNVVLLENSGPNTAQFGLKYVHNDSCYPAILVIGQFIEALSSGKYNTNKTALMITQTGGGCRASNYIFLLRKALKKAGFENIPVISLNLSGLEKNSGFSLTIPLLKELLFCLIYGDCIINLKNQTEPYEVNKGETQKITNKWINTLSNELKNFKHISHKMFKRNIENIVEDFSKIKVTKNKENAKIKVGIVGEIYVKYSSLGNNNLEKFLTEQGCEICVPGVLGFMLFKLNNRIDDIKLYGGNIIKLYLCKFIMRYLLRLEKIYIDAVNKHSCFLPLKGYMHTRQLAKGIIGYGNKMGEGWLLTAEMIELINSGFENIVCAQPFGCLPNHICGKGMVRKITKAHPSANIVTIDYDASVSKVNQENRIKLMLSLAKEKMYK